MSESRHSFISKKNILIILVAVFISFSLSQLQLHFWRNSANSPTVGEAYQGDSTSTSKDFPPPPSMAESGDSTTTEQDENLDTTVFSPPVRINSASLRINNSMILPVGLSPDGTIQLDDTAVSWYMYGESATSDSGVMILISHISFDGVPGGFAHLASANVGDQLDITVADERIRTFEVTDNQLVPKGEVSQNFRQFLTSRSAGLDLYLITCGGKFDPETRHYESLNIVHAVPVGPTNV